VDHVVVVRVSGHRRTRGRIGLHVRNRGQRPDVPCSVLGDRCAV
jgi:hypothetical protein